VLLEVQVGSAVEVLCEFSRSDGSPFDVSAATELVARFDSPVGSAAPFERALTPVVGQAAQASYLSSGADFDAAGEWLVQGRAVVSGKTYWSSIVEVQARRNI